MFCGFAVHLQAAESQQLNLYAEEWAPYHYMEQGKLKGLNYEVVKNICLGAQIKCSFTVVPWGRGYQLAIKTPNSGIFSMMRSPERIPLFHWVGPIADPPMNIYRLAQNSDIIERFQKQPEKVIVGSIRDAQERQVFLNQYPKVKQRNLPEFLDQNTVYEALFKKRVDLVLGNELSLNYFLDKTGRTPESVALLGTLNQSSGGTYLAINKSVSTETVKKLQRAMEALKTKGG